jgi:phosphatidylglycerophosphate synthase
MSTDAPIRDAIVLATGDALRPVARVPLLVRTIIALQRAGIERCTVVGPVLPPGDRRIRCTLASAPTLESPADDTLRLLVGDGAVIDDTLVRDLQTRARPGEVLEMEEGGARVRVAPGRLIAANGGVRLARGPGTLRPAVTGGAERSLLLALENPRDGYLDRLIHRRLSRPLTRFLLRTPLTPNTVTALGIALGMAGGLALAYPGVGPVVAGILMLLASSVLDCSDGELARLSHSESRLGHWLDITGDTAVHLAVLSGIGARIASMGSAPGWPVVALLGLGVVAAFAVVTWSDDTETRRRRVPGWENRILDGVLSPLSTRDWHVFPIAFALAGRLDLLVLGAAIGANVFWVTTLAILLRVLRRARAATQPG